MGPIGYPETSVINYHHSYTAAKESVALIYFMVEN